MFNVDETTIDKEEAGVWATFKGSQFLIASAGSTKFQRIFSRLQMPHRKAIERNKLDPEIQSEIMAKAMSQGLVLNWKNVTDNSGADVPFSVETCYKALSNNAEFREFCSDFGTELSNFLSEEKEDLGKSVEKSSDGKQSTEAA